MQTTTMTKKEGYLNAGIFIRTRTHLYGGKLVLYISWAVTIDDLPKCEQHFLVLAR